MSTDKLEKGYVDETGWHELDHVPGLEHGDAPIMTDSLSTDLRLQPGVDSLANEAGDDGTPTFDESPGLISDVDDAIYIDSSAGKKSESSWRSTAGSAKKRVQLV